MLKVLKFSAIWCGPCQMMAPLFEEVKKEMQGQAEFEEIDIDEDRAMAQKYLIMSVPTFAILKDEEEIARRSGAMSKNELREWIESFI